MPNFSINLTGFEKVSTNKIYAGMHHYKRTQIKQTYLGWFSQHRNRFPKFTNKVNIIMYFGWKSRSLDSSNCSFMAKMIEDCMVHHGVIKDDTTKYVGVFCLESLPEKALEDNVTIIIKDYSI